MNCRHGGWERTGCFGWGPRRCWLRRRNDETSSRSGLLWLRDSFRLEVGALVGGGLDVGLGEGEGVGVGGGVGNGVGAGVGSKDGGGEGEGDGGELGG